MRTRHSVNLTATLIVGLLLAGCRDDQSNPTAPTDATIASRLSGVSVSSVAGMYAADFVSTAATGAAMNNSGDVVGTSYLDPGCGSFCLPTQETVVWRGGNRIVLPGVPSLSGIYPSSINNQGVVAGIAGVPGTTTRAVVWTPNAASYTATDLGALPGMSTTTAAGIDDQGRVVGWSSTGGAIPTAAAPYLWTRTGGMVNLASLGFPNDIPVAISPGGAVATTGSWYQLGNPGSVRPNPPPPRGFFGPGTYAATINDAGDQARFMPTTSGQNLVYPFRLPNGGAWQQISSAGTGRLTRYGIGSINAAQDVSFTAQSTGLIAAGPTGLGQSLAALLSPAYSGATVSAGGPMNDAGQILASVYIGRSPRLVKLTPVTLCGANCLVSSSLVMTGQFVQDPAFPGSCFQGGKMYNLSTATVTMTDESGAPLGNVQVSGRFLDDYWTNKPVTGTTNASGVVTWSHKGLCGVGAIAFLVEKATLGSRVLDRTRGKLADYVIPSIAPVNQPPVARFTPSCNNTTRRCTFNATASTDDVGIVSYAWSFGDGTTGTGSNAVHTYAAAGSYPVTLTVTDGGGLTNAVTKTVTLVAGTNQPPIAAWTVTCQPAPAHVCTFDGTGSSDPDGTIVGYRWTNALGGTLSTSATFARTFEGARTLTWTLAVTDNGGKQGKLTKTFTVP